MPRPELKSMHCPFMRSMFSASDAPTWDQQAQEMEVENLVKFVRDQPGDGSIDKVLKFFAVHNHGVGNRIQRASHLLLGSGGRFSTELIGSDGDHEGGSLIYNPETGEFDREQFARFASFSGDGQALTVKDLGTAIVDANKRHNGSPVNALQSAGEFALLCTLVGDDEGTVRVADMEQLFDANEFPDGARENLGSRTAEHWFALTLAITEAISDEAMRIHHNAAEMRFDDLKGVLEIFFAPLLRMMKS